MRRIYIINILILIMSCSGEKEETSSTRDTPRIKKYSKLISPTINQEFILGEEVNFELSSSKPIDSIALDYEGQIAVYNTDTFVWKADQPKTGFQKLRLSVYTGGVMETHYPKIKFFSDVKPATLGYEVISTLPHSEEAYTQGLFFIGDTLVESTGREGTSKLSKMNLQTGEVYQSTSLSAEYFGEGSAVWNDKIFQLTWQSQVGFVYDLNLNKTGKFNYSHEGWGITTSGDTLYVSDGTEVIHLIDPKDYFEIGRLEVYDQSRKIIHLNELEMIEGKLYANIWLQDLIVTIDPKSGKVLERINMSGLKSRFSSSEAEVLNGIAFKKNSNQIFVTGKLWPKLFEVKFTPNL